MKRREFLSSRLVLTAANLAPRAARAAQGSLEVLISDAAAILYAAGRSLWGLAGSATLHGNKLVLTAVNPHVTEERICEIALRGPSAHAGRGTVLSSTDIHAYNDFENPRAVQPKEQPANLSGSTFTWTFAPASVTRLAIELA